MLKTVSITITGKVQGVYYRQSTKQKARELGITGIVKNNADGTVHIIASGKAEQLSQLIAWCEQGPPNAMVTAVETEDIALRVFESFQIERS